MIQVGVILMMRKILIKLKYLVNYNVILYKSYIYILLLQGPIGSFYFAQNDATLHVIY